MSMGNRLSWTDRAERRKRMASDVSGPASIGRVAAKYGVSTETIRRACQTYAPEKLYGPSPARSAKRTALAGM